MSTLDYVILIVYLGLVAGITALFAGRQKSLKDYFMGSRSIPWYAAAFSGVATIASATSFLGGPGVAFTGNLQYLQYRLAMPLVLGIICGIILPMFFRLQVYSIYEYLERRFDFRVRLLASGLFLLLKAGYLAICIYAPALVLAELSGVSINMIVLGVGGVTALYTIGRQSERVRPLHVAGDQTPWGVPKSDVSELLHLRAGKGDMSGIPQIQL